MEKQIDPLYSRAEHTAFVYETDLDDSQEGSDKLYLANLLTSELLVLEGSGAVIWEVLEKPLKLNEIIHTIAEIYGIAEEIVSPPTIDFINKLWEQKMLQKI